ncbi:MAG: HNH endonuclease [Francisellaceae bacterium]|jgi:intracellular multiplication protein IcmJ|nr:HNH endonuclease [Francisellaceae bacterium]MBT6208267.1 HNH endonuclease [Francisellaceae bacterium]MBT6538263.1 HNH endonuclease [Francisellaceae bacterium]
MKLLSIQISAERGNWQRFSNRRKNKKFSEIQKKVFQRDRLRCRYCGFQSKKYQYVINKDQNYANNKSNNLVTCCSLCLPCFFIDAVGPSNHNGSIIHLPEISQADLNHFCRVLFSSMLKDAPYKGKLQSIYLSLKDRGNPIEELFGSGSSRPEIFGQALIDSQIEKNDKKGGILESLRYLPERSSYTEQILYWKETVFDQIPL